MSDDTPVEWTLCECPKFNPSAIEADRCKCGELRTRHADQGFIPLCMMLWEMDDDTIEIGTVGEGADKKPLVATKENIPAMRQLGDALIKKGMITGYQLVMTLGPPKRC